MRFYILFITLLLKAAAFNREAIDECSRVLSENIRDTFQRVTGEQQLVQFYEKFVEPEQFDPRVELKRSKAAIEKYLRRRSDFAWKAKVSLESREVVNAIDDDVNDPDSKDFVRFMSAKQGNDATTIYEHTHFMTKTKVNETKNFTLHPNANFYSLPTSSMASAVHVPTPLYDRNPELLRKIDWSDIDPIYRTHRDETRDLAFQLFCSESGYMRFFPAASWFWDNPKEHLDLFDCRNTEWYINAATNSKNVLIMLDMSGSMLGQRYEIAKQTTEAILETLSHNDYFNIMPFSKGSYFLDDCNGENGLLQATMRNKKALRLRMNNVSSEGKAEYEKALPHAFTTLLNLPKTWTIHSKEEFALLLQHNGTGRDRLYKELPEHFLGYDEEYDRAISSNNGNPDQGCENVIMLITDGAPNTYKEVFDLYNKDKKVRFFSFLIGEEAIDFEQVKAMACYNRGYMVHVQNMADVEEKVQHYIRTMSRPIGQHAKDIVEGDALWSGVYRERLYLPRPETFAEPVPITNQSFAVMNKMAARRKIRLQKTEARSRMFVTTVSYPVIVKETFMGVAAVNIPLTELNQQAHPANIGGRSYFFMLDQNGFIMFHPQLRPIDPITKAHKPNYNNMDLLELEVPQSQQMRLEQDKDRVSSYHCELGSFAECVDQIRNLTKKMVFDCDNSDPQQLDVLFATELLERVYPQTNTYYSECVEGANFILGLAVSKGDDYRLKRRQRDYDFSRVQMEWMENKQWRVHPHWRYCLLNDTDTRMSKEEAFTVYAKQMKESGKLPQLCQARQQLVEKLLVDLEATSAIQDSWDQQWQYLKDNLIHLVFFTSASGMIRFYNQTLDDYDYADPNYFLGKFIGQYFQLENDYQIQKKYENFVADLNRKSVDDMYFKRSTRMKDTIVFDVSNKSNIWYKSETQVTGYGNNENLTMLAQATKALYIGNALLGVTGFEFAYDYWVNVMGEHGCGPSDDRKWCLLLDEHGYVFYSNQKDISYEDYLIDPLNKGKHIGHWFGHINRVSQRAMALLVEKKFYTRLKYTDHQAICKDKKTIVMAADSLRPLRSLYRWMMYVVNRALRIAKQFSLIPIYQSLIRPIEAYTASFHDGSEGYPCSKESDFYLSNREGRNRPTSTSLVDNARYDKPCPTTKCSIKMHASFVDGTNLIMVWINQGDKSSLCYDNDACPRLDPGEVPFGFERHKSTGDPYEQCTGEHHRRPKRSKAMCYNIVHEGEDSPCSHAYLLSPSISIITSLFLMIFVRV